MVSLPARCCPCRQGGLAQGSRQSLWQVRPTVLIFPTLEAGNIGYKLVQRLAGAEAVGPVLQGMAAPVNDPSRGASVEDIYKMAAITANQSIALKAKKG